MSGVIGAVCCCAPSVAIATPATPTAHKNELRNFILVPCLDSERLFLGWIVSRIHVGGRRWPIPDDLKDDFFTRPRKMRRVGRLRIRAARRQRLERLLVELLPVA